MTAIMALLAAHLGASRWAFARSTATGWKIHSQQPSPRDELLKILAGSLPPAAHLTILPTTELEDAGLRLQATGVESLGWVTAGSAEHVVVAFFEDPAPEATGTGATVPPAFVQRLVEATSVVQDMQQDARELDLLRSWGRTLSEASTENGDEDTLAERIARPGGSFIDAVLVCRPTRRGIAAGGARRGPRGTWHTSATEIEMEAVGAAETVNTAAGALGHSNLDWSIAEAGGLVVAIAGGDLSQATLETAARLTLLGSRSGSHTAAERNNAMLQERARIASVIHEGITQVLTNVVIQMEILDRLLDDPDAARQMVKTLRTAVLEALDSLRGAILEMNPAAPEWTDLAGGLRRFTMDFGAQWGLDLSYRMEGPARDVDPEIIGIVFGFVQESLSNVRKHAGTGAAEVALTFLPDSIEVRVTDEGAGFVPGTEPEEGFRQHQGLMLLRSRVRLAGGRLRIESEPGRGTTLNLEIAA